MSNIEWIICDLFEWQNDIIISFSQTLIVFFDEYGDIGQIGQAKGIPGCYQQSTTIFDFTILMSDTATPTTYTTDCDVETDILVFIQSRFLSKTRCHNVLDNSAVVVLVRVEVTVLA